MRFCGKTVKIFSVVCTDNHRTKAVVDTVIPTVGVNTITKSKFRRNSSMNKAPLIQALAGKCRLTRKDADLAVNAVFDLIIEELEKGEKVQIVGFGCFDVRERPARKGRNPMTGETIETEASRAVSFKPGKALKDAMENE